MKGVGEFSIGNSVWPGTSKLIEEMGELHQVLGKLLGVGGDAENHWSGNLREKLVEEMGDVLAAITFFRKMNMTEDESMRVASRLLEKVQVFNRWHQENLAK